MKYQKATVTIINMGNEDILTCSGEVGCNWPVTYPTNNNNKNQKAGGWCWPWPIWPPRWW